MALLSLADERKALFRDRAEDLLRLAGKATTVGSQALFLCLSQSYREMAAKAQSRLN